MNVQKIYTNIVLEKYNASRKAQKVRVPSFFPSSKFSPTNGSSEQKRILFFAGCASTETQIFKEDAAAAPLSEEEQLKT